MTDFLNRPLHAVTRIFRFFNGDSQRSALDLSAAIQPVYDYSRQSELGARGEIDAGYLYIGETQVHAGAGTLFSIRDIYASFDSIGELVNFDSIGARRDRLWLIDVAATMSVSALTNAGVGLELVATTPSRFILVAFFDKVMPAFITTEPRPLVNGGTQVVEMPKRAPIFIPLGTLVGADSVATAAGTVKFEYTFWAGPKGSTPPGMR